MRSFFVWAWVYIRKFTLQFLPFSSTMHFNWHFRSILILPLRLFLNIKIYYLHLRLFLFNDCFMFLTSSFHFSTLVSNIFLHFSTFEIVWFVGWRFFDLAELLLILVASFIKVVVVSSNEIFFGIWIFLALQCFL